MAIFQYAVPFGDNATPKETLSSISTERTVTSGRERANRSVLSARQSELMGKAVSAFDTPASTEQKEKSDDQVFSEMVLKSIYYLVEKGRLACHLTHQYSSEKSTAFKIGLLPTALHIRKRQEFLAK